MVRRNTILLLIPHLGGGGAERVMAHLAQSLPCDQFDLHLGLVTRGHVSVDFPPCVHIHKLNARRVLFGALGLVNLVQRIKPDLILSGMFHLNFLVLLLRAFFPRTTRIIVRQNGTLSNWTSPPVRLESLLYRMTYPWAEAIVSQTPAMAAEMRQFLGPKARIHVLRNPVDVRSIQTASEGSDVKWTSPGPHLVSVGRLSPEKGFHRLLDAFAMVRMEYPHADLVILGEGAQRSALASRCAALGLASSVRLPGYVSQPASWLAGATLLVIPSTCDALPNVLLEGAAAGLPIVTTPCSPGVIELIRDQTGVWLTEDLSVQALRRSLTAALATLRPGDRFQHSWLAPFELREAVARYRALILETLAQKAAPGAAECLPVSSAPAADDCGA